MAANKAKKGSKTSPAAAKPEKLDYKQCTRKIAELENTFKKTQKPELLTQIAELYFSIGSLEPAFAFFTKASTIDPGNYSNYKGIADCLVITQRAEEALEYYRMALNLNPEAEIVRTSYGHTLMHLKKYEEAAKIYEEGLKLNDSGEANNNVGVLLFETKNYKQSVVFFNKAVEKDPKNKNFRINLARAYFRGEKYNDAFFTLHAALKVDPGSAFIKSQLSAMGRHLSFSTFSQDLKDALIACLNIENIEHHNLSVVWLRLFLMDPAYTYIHKLTKLHNYDDFKGEADLYKICALMSDDFCAQALRLIYNQAVDYEIFLGNLRRLAGEHIGQGAGKTASSKDSKTLFKILCALAENFFVHEYPAAMSNAEKGALGPLRQEILDIGKNDPGPCALRLALLACYGPLHKEQAEIVALARALPDDLHPFWKSLVALQIAEPLEELRLRSTIPALGRLQNEVSLKVREQYEENPYPRWRYANAQEDESKSYHFKKPYDLLIAGCGTGKQVLQERYMYPNAKITAIDLSLSSISYAKRKIQELGVGDVEFMQADILELGQLNKKFDFIACSGVLHHMQEPEAGLKVLLSLLKPKGLMNIGLYSERARQTVVKLRNLVAEKGWQPNTAGIHAFRDYINNLPPDHELRYVTRWRDYYSMSMVRDLIFHVQEHRYTFPQLDDMFKRHGLAFVDFSFIFPDVLANFLRKHPGPENYRNFELWDAFERKHPESFASMYQLWVCREEARDEILAAPKIINALEV